MLVDFSQANDLSATKVPDSANNYWNTVTGTAGDITSNPLSLIDIGNQTTGISLTVGFGSPITGEGFAGQPAGDANPGPGSGLLNQAFAYTDGIFTNSNATSGITLTLSGLQSNTLYSFSIYAGRNANGSNADIGLLTGSSLTGDTLVENRTLADFNITSDATGVISFRYRDTTEPGGAGSLLTAMSITQVPEPSAALLGGLGLFALLRRRRS